MCVYIFKKELFVLACTFKRLGVLTRSGSEDQRDILSKYVVLNRHILSILNHHNIVRLLHCNRAIFNFATVFIALCAHGVPGL